MAAKVPPTGLPDIPFAGEVDPEHRLIRAAQPVVELLLEETADARLAVLLTDDQPCILARWGGDSRLREEKDEHSACPGFVFAEQSRGTNGLGTPLEEGEPTIVDAADHFVEDLAAMSAVGAPIVHPITKRIEGVVDLVSSDPIAPSLTLPLVARMARDIGNALLNGYAGSDRALLDDFLRAERGGTRRPVFGINERLVIANPSAADLLPDGGHLLLWEQVQRALRTQQQEVLLSSRVEGTHLRAKVLKLQEQCTGAILRLFDPAVPGGKQRVREDPNRSAKSALARQLPGRSARWAMARDSAYDLSSRREWILLRGPSGVGKTALVRAVTRAVAPEQPLARHEVPVAEGSDLEQWLLQLAAGADAAPSTLFLAHLERLDDSRLEWLCRWLDQIGPDRPQVIAGYTSEESVSDVPAVLLGQFPNVLDIPALEDRPEDVLEIAAAIAAAGPEPSRLDPKAVRELMRYHWPGNVRQLRRVVLSALAASPGSVIRAEDLPELVETKSAQRPLSSLERVERRAILDALRACEQNKQAAAAELGISRSTLYRKLAILGISA